MLPTMYIPILEAASSCPFLDQTPGRCRAAFAVRPLKSSRRASRCQSDDHDNCPLFMAQLLRSSPVERTGVVLNLHLK